MDNARPIFDPGTQYRIEVQCRVNVEWLESFGGSAESIVDESTHMEENTVLYVNTDQSGIVGLVRRLHGLRITILQLQIVSQGGKAAEVDVRDQGL